MSQARSARLHKFFFLVLHGKRPVTSVENVKLLIEAIQAQDDHAVCIERIIASPEARNALQTGLRFDVTPVFLNQYTAAFIHYLADPAVKQLCNGQFLQELLTLLVEPRTLWNAFLQAFLARQLNPIAIHAFAWLLAELLLLPPSSKIDIVEDARKVDSGGSLLQSPSTDIRTLGYKIKHILQVKSTNLAPVDSEHGPGGRHDNDFDDFRKIAIYPTSDEFLSTAKPFYRHAAEINDLPAESRISVHLDNQFRLLREDMLSEIREEFQIARGKKKRRRAVPLLQKLALVGVIYEDNRRRLRPCTLAITCQSGLESMTKSQGQRRKTFLEENRNYLRHKSFGCLLRNGEIIAFAILERNVDELLKEPPEIVLQIIGEDALKKTLLYFKLYNDIQFLLVDAPVFAYEPILRCLQEKATLPLARELLRDQQGEPEPATRSELDFSSVIESLEALNGNLNVQDIIKTQKPIHLDRSQLDSLMAGLTQRVSLIQGPPGTGKSFIGALLAKVFLGYSKETLLVMCYTNHALDQFLEDLLDIGINPSHIVRLGSKSTLRTSQLTLSKQRVQYIRSQSSWNVINKLDAEANDIKKSLSPAFATYRNLNTNTATILEYLEFEHPEFFEAFIPPEQEGGMTLVGEKNRSVDSSYLFNRWSKGNNHGLPTSDHLSEESRRVWDMSSSERQSHLQAWEGVLVKEQVENVQRLMQRLDTYQSKVDKVWNEKTRTILQSKRIIGCTTTAAAMYASDLALVSPGIVLLEEAGEILESHVLTAMGPQTKQLVLIGDHQQLRPKINMYALSVEHGEGYDLNRSLFERLVVSEYPHTTLAKQHRMCPEISGLIKHLTYPDLQDDPKTLNRPRPRGLQDRVIFINHDKPETTFADISDRRDENTKGSKRNEFEANMVLKIVRYLGQQGYKTDKLIVLTPYLGQLHLLRDLLRKEADPVLNDLDSYDLVRAGLLSQAGAHHAKRPIRLSTIDNYQGEESDIVIATLTRSNKDGDIGFMAAPQRLNVLLSRARNVLIMIGNTNTFVKSRKGRQVWTPFIDHLSANHHLYDGLPVKCEQHPQFTAILRTLEDFDIQCPDGGCQLPCGTKLNCGVHECPYKCHQLSDHSKMQCYKITEWRCSRNHRITKPCSQIQKICQLCSDEDQAKERQHKRDMELEAERARRQKAYMLELTKLQDEIARMRRLQKDTVDEEERRKVLQQHRQDLENLRAGPRMVPSVAKRKGQGPSEEPGQKSVPTDRSTNGSSSNGQNDNRDAQKKDKNQASPAEVDWKYQKDYEGAKSDEIDTLMGMIGLEDVKQKFLAVKAKVDTATRQNIDLKDERFGTVLIGNPGTGKTTVARLYAKFLTSVGVIPGASFVETTGSRLANSGVTGCEKQINDILNNGGGVLFIDEAYQLVQSHGFGSQVLDFLLAEVERLTGKMVIVLAGYRSHMEKFFAQNPGLPSRFPHEFKFNDYEDDELCRILDYRIAKKYNGRMKVEGGQGGLYCRIVARRVGHGRGHEGFGNARAVENAFARIVERQAKRLAIERRNSGSAEDMLFTKEDLIGPEPSQALQNSSAWRKLQAMIGLDAVKKTVRALLDSIQYNYQRELEEKPLVEFTLNRVFLGSPGTGKTTVAKLYGQILVDIGYLSNGEVVVKNPADFIGAVIGQSEQNTKGILASTVGKVLVIDEAYGLYGGGSRNSMASQTDPFKTAIVDTIVAEVQSVPGDDRCVLLLGYQEQMSEMFQNVNPGLARRFPMDSAFVFEDFTDDELGQILDLKLKQQGFETTDRGRKAAMEVLSRARNRPHFGNAGEIDILLNGAKIHHQQRLSSDKSSADSQLEPQDFDKDYDRGERAETNIPMLFAGTVGCEKIVEQLEGYRQTVRNMRQLDMDPRDQIPFNFLFKGPPGTGKTTTARKIGKVYYDMGFLASADVIEGSATDLVGQYIGQTGPKTQALLEKALGKVLLIDEAYRLGEGQFAKEAMDEIVDCITKPKFHQKLIIVLAGYDTEINRLMATNPGLTSRFPEAVEFRALSAEHCLNLLTQLLQARKAKARSKSTTFDLAALETPRAEFQREVTARFASLIHTSNWANARDVQTLAKAIFGKCVRTIINGCLFVKEDIVLAELDQMISERSNRQRAPVRITNTDSQYLAFDHQSKPMNVTTKTSITEQKAETQETQTDPPNPVLPHSDVIARDANVSDATWAQLQLDKQAAEARENEDEKLKAQEAALSKTLEERRARDIEDEQERIRRELEEAELERLRREREAAEQRQREERKAQQKLREMGVCCMGYRWIKQARGYRCAGGAHYVSNEQLGI